MPYWPLLNSVQHLPISVKYRVVRMATNKNQHFVPRCYLRPFTINSANLAINLFNIDRLKFIECAPVKHQCSRDYFYGEEPDFEKALQFTETAYAKVLRDILKPGYRLKDSHCNFLRRFWLLQHMRTEAASRYVVEMSEAMVDVIGREASSLKIGIRQAVKNSMRVFVETMKVVDDLRICLLRNRTSIPFITSDDPAVLTNRWYLEDRRTFRKSFGIHSAGTLLMLPISPNVLCMGYDSDVYSIPHQGGLVDVRHDADIQAFNQHQFLNCRANIFFHDSAYARGVSDAFNKFAPLRPNPRYKIHYAVLDSREEGFTRYRAVDRRPAGDHQEALIHTQTVHARPSAWPKQILWRSKGAVFTNGSGVGFVRRAGVESGIYQGFRKEFSRKHR